MEVVWLYWIDLMRVLQIANYKPGSGGISVQVEKIHDCLSGEGVDNAVFSLKGSAAFRIKAFFGLLREGKKFDVFHIHTCSGGGFLTAVMGILVGRSLKKRIVLTYHGGDGRRFFEKRTRLVKWFLHRTDVNIALSGFLGSVFDDFDIPHVVIPNIIELDASRFKLREIIKPNFISIRTLSPLYNIECIIKAFQIVKSKLPVATLTIVGDGPSRVELENMVAERQIKDVVFVGRVPNSQIYGYLEKSDIMLSAPKIDNMPVSILEAFNAGLLVISSNVGGVPYMIEDSVNGLLFESDNHVMLAEKMVEAVENSEASMKMIRNANECVRKYSWDRIKNQLLKVYEYESI